LRYTPLEDVARADKLSGRIGKCCFRVKICRRLNIGMTNIQYDQQDAAMQSEQRTLDKKIRTLADHIPTGFKLADGDHRQMETIKESERLLEARVRLHEAYCNQQ
jgi:hypothetical protein